MKRVLLTGMSGTGKSTMLRMLASDRIAVLELDDWMDESPWADVYARIVGVSNDNAEA